MVPITTHSKKSKQQKSNLYKKQSLYRDTVTISSLASNDGVGTNALRASTTPVPTSKDSKYEDSEATKSLKQIVGSDDSVKVARLGRMLLKFYSLEQKT